MKTNKNDVKQQQLTVLVCQDHLSVDKPNANNCPWVDPLRRVITPDRRKHTCRDDLKAKQCFCFYFHFPKKFLKRKQ